MASASGLRCSRRKVMRISCVSSSIEAALTSDRLSLVRMNRPHLFSSCSMYAASAWLGFGRACAGAAGTKGSSTSTSTPLVVVIARRGFGGSLGSYVDMVGLTDRIGSGLGAEDAVLGGPFGRGPGL